MSRLTLSKTELHRQMRRLRVYEKFLPALDLKRRQLLAEQIANRQILADVQRDLDRLMARVRRDLPMLADEHVPVAGLVEVEAVRTRFENVVGTRLPVFEAVRFRRRPYSFLGKPHWVDRLVELLEAVLSCRARLDVLRQRQGLLDRAVRRTTQRVNLFEKVLVPRTRGHIHRIRIVLSDAERSAVVRARIAKARQVQGPAS